MAMKIRSGCLFIQKRKRNAWIFNNTSSMPAVLMGRFKDE
jgi:hypothetical protein